MGRTRHARNLQLLTQSTRHAVLTLRPGPVRTFVTRDRLLSGYQTLLTTAAPVWSLSGPPPAVEYVVSLPPTLTCSHKLCQQIVPYQFAPVFVAEKLLVLQSPNPLARPRSSQGSERAKQNAHEIEATIAVASNHASPDQRQDPGNREERNSGHLNPGIKPGWFGSRIVLEESPTTVAEQKLFLGWLWEVFFAMEVQALEKGYGIKVWSFCNLQPASGGQALAGFT